MENPFVGAKTVEEASAVRESASVRACRFLDGTDAEALRSKRINHQELHSKPQEATSAWKESFHRLGPSIDSINFWRDISMVPFY
jgi:hypothetical protein